MKLIQFSVACLLRMFMLIQFKYPMFVYEEYFNACVSISHITIFTFARYISDLQNDLPFVA